MSEIRRRFEPTRGEKQWALDMASRFLWHELWTHTAAKHGLQGSPSDEELQRALGIIEHMTATLARSRGTLRANRPGRKP